MSVSNKNNIFGVAVLIFMCFFTINSFAVVRPTQSFYVNDYANLLDQDTEDYIINTNIELYEKTGAQIVIVTVQNLEENSLEEYATELFRSFGIGDKDKNNGVLLLLALEERQFRIEVGYGLEGALTDAKTGRIQDNYIIPYLKEERWNDGIRNGFNAILEEVTKEYGVNIEGEIAVPIQQKKPENFFIWLSVICCITIVFETIIKDFVRTRKISMRKAGIITAIYMVVTVSCMQLMFLEGISTFCAEILAILLVVADRRETF